MVSLSKTIKISEVEEGIIEKEEYNKVFNRLQYVIRIFHSNLGTPSRQNLRKAIASFLNVDEDSVIIRKIQTERGISSSKVIVRVYKDKDMLKKIEPKYLFNRGVKKNKEGGEGVQGS